MPTESPGASRATSLLSRRPLLAAIIALLLAASTLAVPAHAGPTPAGLGGFDPGALISDEVMFDGNRMSASEVDQFLRDQGANCRTARGGAPCLKDVRMDTPQRAATDVCEAVPARTQGTAGEMITDVSRACSVNPQVLLVMLQKEQGLITTTSPTWTKLDQALGFRCPDFEACDPRYAGLGHQLYHAAKRLQEYGDASRGYRYQVGANLIQYSPYPFCGEASVNIANRATAALYNYTPFTPTQATLDAGAGAVADDVCATYGNRNFFRNFSLWFGSPNGTSAHAYPVAAPMGRTPQAPFRDVNHGDLVFFTEIAWMEHTGLSMGWPDGTYRPFEPIKRDAMAAFLYRAAGSPAYTPPAVSPFKDVSPTREVFYKEITWAHSEGIAEGWPDGTFRPYEPVKRDAMAAFLYRAQGSPPFTAPAVSPLKDISARDTIFYKEISWAYSEGITTGWPDGSYRPYSPILRDAMAAFIYRVEVD